MLDYQEYTTQIIDHHQGNGNGNGNGNGYSHLEGDWALFYKESAEIVLLNPLNPPFLGDFRGWGTPPDPRQEESCPSFSAVCFGDSRNSQGNLATDKLFTGQRLDGTGLYYYGARYYDAGIGRFISADTIVPAPFNPQSLNRYSYVINNPLRYIDPTGHKSILPPPPLPKIEIPPLPPNGDSGGGAGGGDGGGGGNGNQVSYTDWKNGRGRSGNVSQFFGSWFNTNLSYYQGWVNTFSHGLEAVLTMIDGDQRQALIEYIRSDPFGVGWI